jgi:hypothetical protein
LGCSGNENRHNNNTSDEYRRITLYLTISSQRMTVSTYPQELHPTRMRRLFRCDSGGDSIGGWRNGEHRSCSVVSALVRGSFRFRVRLLLLVVRRRLQHSLVVLLTRSHHGYCFSSATAAKPSYEKNDEKGNALSFIPTQNVLVRLPKLIQNSHRHRRLNLESF